MRAVLGSGLLAALVLLLSGCAHEDIAPPAIVTKTLTVYVPVATRCIDPAQVKPMPPLVGGLLTGDAQHDEDILADSAMKLRSALDADLALIGGCTK